MENVTLRLEVNESYELIAVWDDLSESYLLYLEHDKGARYALPFEPRDLGDMQLALEMLQLGKELL